MYDQRRLVFFFTQKSVIALKKEYIIKTCSVDKKIPI